MKIEVQVKPHARRESVEKLPDGTYKISLNAPPTEGRANIIPMPCIAFPSLQAEVRIKNAA